MIKISVVIPTYNEAGNIVSLIRKVQKELKNKMYEIIIVDDSSPDNTYQIVKNTFAKDKRVRPILHKGPPELGDSILQGVRLSTGDIIIGMDADFNHDPQVIKLLLKKIVKKDLVVASRFIKDGGMEDSYRYLTSWVFNLVLRFFFKFPITDNTSGFYAITRECLDSLPISEIYRGYGEYHLRLVYLSKEKGFSLGEVPVFYKNRLNGVSKSHFFTMTIEYLLVAWKCLCRIKG